MRKGAQYIFKMTTFDKCLQKLGCGEIEGIHKSQRLNRLHLQIQDSLTDLFVHRSLHGLLLTGGYECSGI